MAVAVLTVFSTVWIGCSCWLTVFEILQNFVVRFHRYDGSFPSRIERLYVVILQIDLQNLIEVQDGFVCVADLEIRVDHPFDLPSRENAFFIFFRFFLDEHSSLEVCVDYLLETTRCFRNKNLEPCLQLAPGDGF